MNPTRLVTVLSLFLLGTALAPLLAGDAAPDRFSAAETKKYEMRDNYYVEVGDSQDGRQLTDSYGHILAYLDKSEVVKKAILNKNKNTLVLCTYFEKEYPGKTAYWYARLICVRFGKTVSAETRFQYNIPIMVKNFKTIENLLTLADDGNELEALVTEMAKDGTIVRTERRIRLSAQKFLD